MSNNSYFSRIINSKKGKQYKLTISNVDPRIVSSIIGKKGSIHQSLVKSYSLDYIHITEPYRNKDFCDYNDIIVVGKERSNVISATGKILSILKDESECYIEIDFKTYLDNEQK
tara:strand:- start:325 stop:666 length:342 start_codon:yes stop_codon:yes gene_type:complete